MATGRLTIGSLDWNFFFKTKKERNQLVDNLDVQILGSDSLGLLRSLLLLLLASRLGRHNHRCGRSTLLLLGHHHLLLHHFRGPNNGKKEKKIRWQ